MQPQSGSSQSTSLPLYLSCSADAIIFFSAHSWYQTAEPKLDKVTTEDKAFLKIQTARSKHNHNISTPLARRQYINREVPHLNYWFELGSPVWASCLLRAVFFNIEKEPLQVHIKYFRCLFRARKSNKNVLSLMYHVSDAASLMTCITSCHFSSWTEWLLTQPFQTPFCKQFQQANAHRHRCYPLSVLMAQLTKHRQP